MLTSAAVDLPDGDLIDCHDFAHAIARFRYPVPEEGAIGMACITGSKIVDYSFRARPEISVSEPQREGQQVPLDFPVERFDPAPYAIPCPPLIAEVQLPLPVPGMLSELSFPVALAEKNRVLLEALLNELPPLKYPMSEWEQGRFLAAFREKVDVLQLVGDECWEPILVTESYVELQRRRQDSFLAENGMIALGEEFARGLAIVDRAGHSVETFDARLGAGHYFLPRAAVIDILVQLNFPCRDADASYVVGGRVSESIPTIELENDKADTSGEQASAKKPPLEPEDWLKIVKLHAQLESDPKAKKSSAQVALQFKRSESYIRRIIRMSRDILEGASDQDLEELAKAISAKYKVKVPLQYVEALVAWERGKSAGAKNWVFSGKT